MEKDYRELYEKITNSDWFKKAYHDKSLGGCPIVIEEMEESEDERIRKELIKFFNSQIVKVIRGIPVKDILAYLEKQKILTENGNGVYAYYNGVITLIDGYAQENPYGFAMSALEGQKPSKEQKPMEPSNDELQKHQDELYGFKVFATNQAREHHIWFTRDFEWNNFCAELLSYFNEKQKPAEWDDYTKTNLDRALQIIKDAKGKLQGYQSDDGIYECDKAIECLEHFLYRGLEIEKSAEWSEEIQKDICAAAECLREYANNFVQGGNSKRYVLDLADRIEFADPQSKQEWGEENEPKPEKGAEKKWTPKFKEGDFFKYNGMSQEAKIYEIKRIEEHGCVAGYWCEQFDTPTNGNVWFSSFEEKYMKPYEPEPEEEWSEEDERKLQNCIKIVEKWEDDYDIADERYSSILKSLRGRPKPSDNWKPSEEQIEALWNTLHPDDPYYVDLSSLYDDLKKL